MFSACIWRKLITHIDTLNPDSVRFTGGGLLNPDSVRFTGGGLLNPDSVRFTGGGLLNPDSVRFNPCPEVGYLIRIQSGSTHVRRWVT